MASLGSSLLQTASTGTAFSTSHRPAQIASHSLRPLKARRASELMGSFRTVGKPLNRSLTHIY